MKKLIFILSLFISAASFGQTKEETIAFLKTYYSKTPHSSGYFNNTVNYYDEYVTFSNCRAWSEKMGCAKKGEDIRINLKSVVAITYKFQEYKNLGDGGYQPRTWILTVSASDKEYKFEILHSQEPGYMEKFKKALLKYAEYGGAKIANEDLFGN